MKAALDRRLGAFGAALRRHAGLIRRLQWAVVLLYAVLLVIPAWLPLPEPWRSQEFAEAANALDVGVASGEHFAAGQFAAPQGVRLSLSQPATDARVAEGLERLASLLRATPPTNPLL